MGESGSVSHLPDWSPFVEFEASWYDTHNSSDMSALDQVTDIYRLPDLGLEADIVVLITTVPVWHGAYTMTAFDLSPAVI